MNLVSLILRVALALSLLYPAIVGFINPLNWIGYFPSFLLNSSSGNLFLIVFGIFEIILALWILSGWKIIHSSSIAFVLLILIVLLNLSQFIILFRDVSIALSALALIVLHRKYPVISKVEVNNP